jgi:hypothetical protein
VAFILSVVCFILLVGTCPGVAGEFHPNDTTQPNEFYFTSDLYYVDEDAGVAVIEVGFIAGDRSLSGSVNFRTANGSATSGQDYTGVTNTLVFSGPAPTRTFTIPIQLDELTEGNETVQLSLSNSAANITRSTATLIIVDKPFRPKLTTARTNNTITLSWPTNTPSFVLQKATNLNVASWINLPPATNTANGNFIVTTPAIGNAFFRLSRTNSP